VGGASGYQAIRNGAVGRQRAVGRGSSCSFSPDGIEQCWSPRPCLGGVTRLNQRLFSANSVVTRRAAYRGGRRWPPGNAVLCGLSDLRVRRRVVAVERGGGAPNPPSSASSVLERRCRGSWWGEVAPGNAVLCGLSDLRVRRRVVAVERGGGAPNPPSSASSVLERRCRGSWWGEVAPGNAVLGGRSVSAVRPLWSVIEA
jgi:hypothetical protein